LSAVVTDVRTLAPFRIAAPHDDSILNEHLLKFGMFAPTESLIFALVLRQCQQARGTRAPLVIDVGVNIGYFSLLALAFGCRVIGFEPQTRILPFVRRSLALNAGFAERYTVFNCAASSSYNHVDMVEPNTAWSMVKIKEGATAPIPAVRLDDIIPQDEKVLLLKVDVEGFEDSVVKGALALLPRVTHVVMEIKIRNRKVVPDLIISHGFQCRQIMSSTGVRFLKSPHQ